MKKKINKMINLITILSIISILACLYSIYRNYKKNLEIVIINIWLFLSNLIYLINSILWNNNNLYINNSYCYFSCFILNATQYGFFFSFVIIIWNIFEATNINFIKKRSFLKIIFITIIPFVFSITTFLLRNYKYSVSYIIGCNINLPNGFLKFILHDFILLTSSIISGIFWVLSIIRIVKIKRKVIENIENNILNIKIQYELLFFCIIYIILSLIGTLYVTIQNIINSENFFNFVNIRKNIKFVNIKEIGPEIDDYLMILTSILLSSFINIKEINKKLLIFYNFISNFKNSK